ncbi:MAG: peroxiredoxin [Acidobacteria bacterium]|nr:peroxiredoxin [Acidobacteriota bacterium]
MQRAGLWSVFAIALIVVLVTAKMAWAAAGDMLAVGATAPNFTLPSQDNTPVHLSDFKGKWVVLYFYPKDMTSGCTLEAHNFQRDQAKYNALNAAIVGVSLDTPDSHKTFCTKENLTFKLLADPDHKVVDAYGVPVLTRGQASFAKRVTYLISPDGKVAKVWPAVKPGEHSEEVLAELQTHKK